MTGIIEREGSESAFSRASGRPFISFTSRGPLRVYSCLLCRSFQADPFSVPDLPGGATRTYEELRGLKKVKICNPRCNSEQFRVIPSNSDLKKSETKRFSAAHRDQLPLLAPSCTKLHQVAEKKFAPNGRTHGATIRTNPDTFEPSGSSSSSSSQATEVFL